MDELVGKKILFIITKSNWGGAQAYVQTLATRYQEAGAHVVVALGGTGAEGAGAGLLASRLEAVTVRTIFIRAFKGELGFSTEFRALFELISVLRRERPDVVHLNSSKAGGLGALAARMIGIKRVIFTAHGWAHREDAGNVSCALRWFLSWFTVLLCNQVIVLSNDDLKHSPAWGVRHKLVRIYNGTSPFSLQSPHEARVTIEARVPNASTFPFWYLSLAELHPNKGLDVLIRAFAEVAGEHADTALIIVGDGSKRAELASLARSLSLESRVFFTGFIPHARELLPAGDVFVLSSRKEGLPFVLLEAGQARLPVVATRVGGVPEIVEDEVSGLLVPIGSFGLLSTALKRMRVDEALRTRSSFALHARIVRDFSEENMLLETVRTYTF